jgi:hypothetical protein
VPHADRLDRTDRRIVLGTDEEANGRDAFEEEPAQIGEPARTVAAAAHLRVYPHLLELHGVRRPRRCLGLEENHPVLDPSHERRPRLRARPPPEAVGIAAKGIDAELHLVRRGACRQEELEVVERGSSDPAVARLRGIANLEDGLPRTVLPRCRQPRRRLVPQLRDGAASPISMRGDDRTT